MGKYNRGFISYPFLVILVMIIVLSEAVLFYSNSNIELLSLLIELDEIAKVETIASIKLKGCINEFEDSDLDEEFIEEDEEDTLNEITEPDCEGVIFSGSDVFVEVNGLTVKFEMSEDLKWILDYSIMK